MRWAPQSKPQWEAFLTPAFETLFGGSAGGGKSDLLLGLAYYSHKSVLLLRRTFPDLERSLIQRSWQIYGDVKRYNGSKHVWRFDDQTIEFGHLEHNKDVAMYQSAQYDLIGFDELTQFTSFQYEYMLSRARTVIPGQRVRVVGCTNPGGEGNDWVMERWAPWLDKGYPHPARPGELRWFKRLKDGREVECEPNDPDGVSRTFIPAKLEDNPYLGDEYRRLLNLLPEPYRSQLLNGDWQAGQMDDAYQVIPTAWIRAAMDRWKEEDRPEGGNPVIGVDVARGGEDQTVLAKCYKGWWVAPLQKVPGRLTPDGQSVAQLIALALTEGGRANVDVVGVGASAYDIARLQKLKVSPINFAERSIATDKSGQLRFTNLRAECYWRLRELLDPRNKRKISLPDDPELLGDLRAPRWTLQANGIRIEEKEEIRERLGRSPDCADAVVQAFWKDPNAGPLVLWGMDEE